LIIKKEETWKASHVATGTAMDPGYSLPLNVALITLQVRVPSYCRITITLLKSISFSLVVVLQELDDGSVLLRLAHLYEVMSSLPMLCVLHLAILFFSAMTC